MKRYSLILIILSAFIFSGCIFDKLKKKEYSYVHSKTMYVNTNSVSYKNYNKPRSTEVKKNSKIKKKKIIKKRKYIKKVIKKTTIKKDKKRKIVKKKSTSRKQKVIKKSKKKHLYRKNNNHKKTYKKRVKKYFEPYSLEKNELDPELLGPQTTIKKNPLHLKPKKI